NITSKDNPRIRELAKLCASSHARRESGRYVIEGARLVCDAARSGVAFSTVFFTPEGLRRAGATADCIAEAAQEVYSIDETLGKKIAQTESTQGVFALCEGRLLQESLPAELSGGCLLLCSLQDPGNVGTILRSADAFGLSAVILTADCPDPASPKVLRASMGAAFRLPLVGAPDAAAAIDALRARGLQVYAAALSKDSVPIREASLRGAAVAIGNEGAGLSDETIARCDQTVTIPIALGSESLNAAMAATIFAWELSGAGRTEK
ncbi:MAG: RNA methyltransferase, partial [Oscillospiraceae bacterium]